LPGREIVFAGSLLPPVLLPTCDTIHPRENAGNCFPAGRKKRANAADTREGRLPRLTVFESLGKCFLSAIPRLISQSLPFTTSCKKWLTKILLKIILI
jgi:hypothetical protein